MTQFLNPFSGRQFLDSNGNPYVGAKLFSYTAGTSTKATLTKDEAGSSNHTNPIILNARGEPADAGGSSQAMWQTAGVSIKLVLAPSTDTDPPLSAISTWDNLDGINDGSLIQDQWIAGPAPTYISATSFSLVGDKTTDFHVGRRLKTTNSGGTIYSTITASAFTTLTTVTVVNDSGALDSGLSAVSYGLISATSTSIPGVTISGNNWIFQGGIGPNYLQNIGILPSAASKALTVAFKTKAIADISATDPIQIAFRNVTLTTGNYVARSAIVATSVVAPSGATLGFTASQTGYVYVYALDNAGTVETIITGSNHWDEGALQSTTAISATADSGSVLYSTTARTNVPIRYIGRIKIQTGPVAGEWDNQHTEVHVGRNVRENVIQTVRTVSAAVVSGTTVLPVDDTIPQNTEGTEFLTVTITPKSAMNTLRITTRMLMTVSAVVDVSTALFQDTTVGALSAITGSNTLTAQILEHTMIAGTTSATTFKIRVGPGGAATVYMNASTAGARFFGGVSFSRLTVEEIQLS